jgi:hypothetical protein
MRFGFEDLVPPPVSTPGPRPSESRVLHLNYGGVVGWVRVELTSSGFSVRRCIHVSASSPWWCDVTESNRCIRVHSAVLCH